MDIKQQILEIKKCKESIVYFIENYCYIQHPVEGVIPFKLYEFQREVLREFTSHRFNIVNKSRQIGLSTLTACYALWYALFHKNKTITIISIKDEDAKEFLKKIKLAFEMLPDWMSEEPIVNNVHTLHLTSGSIITSVASGSQAARGRAISLLIIDECVTGDTLIKVRNKTTGQIREIPISDLYGVLSDATS